MRKRSGFIVRFVDVVLILLFAFINISNVRHGDVILPTSSEALLLPPDTDEVVYVGVDSDGRFLVDQDHLLESNAELRNHLSEIFQSPGDNDLSVRVLAMHDAPMRAVQAAVLEAGEVGAATSLAVRLAKKKL